MRKQITLVLLLLVFTAKASEYNDVDRAYEMLDQLARDARQSIQELNEAWNNTEQIFQKDIQQTEDDVQAQQVLCDNRDQEVDDTKQSIENTQHFIKWIAARIQANLERIDTLFELRCEDNRTYIETMKEDKSVLKLIEFLREAIKNKESLSFTQKIELGKKVNEFVELYNHQEIATLLQLSFAIPADADDDNSALAQTNDDDDEDKVSADDLKTTPKTEWRQYKAELIELLDLLEERMNNEIEQNTQDEIDAGIYLAEFKLNLERENKELARNMDDQESLLPRLQKQLVVDQNNAWFCKNDLKLLQQSLDDTKAQYTAGKAEYNEKLEKLQEEVKIFKEVRALYMRKVASNGNDFKKRVDDYNDDGEFGMEGYDDRGVDDIDFVDDEFPDKHAAEKAAEEAAKAKESDELVGDIDAEEEEINEREVEEDAGEIEPAAEDAGAIEGLGDEF